MGNTDFNPWKRQSKDSWLDQVKQDNPNLVNSENTRIIENGILAKSFAFPTDLKNEGHVFKINGDENYCKVGIKLQYEGIAVLKSALTIALENGVEYIHFVLPQNCTKENLNRLIENVYLDMLMTRWSCPSEEIQENLDQLISREFANAPVFYSCDNSTKIDYPDIKNKTSIYSFAPFHSSSWAKTISNLLHENTTNFNFSNKIIFEIYLNNDFLLNICSVRALKLVLNKIWKIYDLNTEVFFEATIDESVLNQDVHANIYKMAAIALSVSISGVDFLIVPPSDSKTGVADFQWLRTSLHTQHILKQEAHLINLIDPTAGAYFIEDLTEQIAEKLWLDLQEKIQND